MYRGDVGGWSGKWMEGVEWKGDRRGGEEKGWRGWSGKGWKGWRGRQRDRGRRLNEILKINDGMNVGSLCVCVCYSALLHFTNHVYLYV